MSKTVDFLLTWPALRLAQALYQSAKENAELRNRVHELENELFWIKAAERTPEAEQ